MTTSVLSRSCPQEPVAIPVPVRLGLLGFGTVGSAVAKVSRAAAALFHARGLAPVVSAALVRDAAKPRAAASLAALLTTDVDRFFAAPIDVVIEALGNAEPARTWVARALERGIPVVTANKTLVAAHGEELLDLARRCGTTLRYEAACIAGVPFLGTFERRPLGRRVRAVAGILNGTSNAILTAVSAGVSFDAALADAQRRGLAEPDPSADIGGEDAAQKLAILIRLFGRRLVAASEIPRTPLDAIDAGDITAAAAFGGRVKPLAYASWDENVRAFVSPAFLDERHPLARVSHVTNGVLLDAEGGPQCYIGPGAGPEVTASTLLDDVIEVLSEPSVRLPLPQKSVPAAIAHPDSSRWFIRIGGTAPAQEIADLLGSFGIWCERLSTIADRRYALTFPSPPDRVRAATAALSSAGGRASAIPALGGEAAC